MNELELQYGKAPTAINIAMAQSIAEAIRLSHGSSIGAMDVISELQKRGYDVVKITAAEGGTRSQ